MVAADSARISKNRPNSGRVGPTRRELACIASRKKEKDTTPMRRQQRRPPHTTSSCVKRWFSGQNAASVLHRTILRWWTPGSASGATTHQAWTRNNLNSSNDNLFNNTSASYNTSSCPLAHFCNLLVHLTQTPSATPHSHKA